MSVPGFWYNGHYRRKLKVADPRIDKAYMHFYAFIMNDVEERPNVWQRIVMALQGWWWSDKPTPPANAIATKDPTT